MQEQEKLNGNGDLRYFASEMIRSSIIVTLARRNVDSAFSSFRRTWCGR